MFEGSDHQREGLNTATLEAHRVQKWRHPNVLRLAVKLLDPFTLGRRENREPLFCLIARIDEGFASITQPETMILGSRTMSLVSQIENWVNFVLRRRPQGAFTYPVASVDLDIRRLCGR